MASKRFCVDNEKEARKVSHPIEPQETAQWTKKVSQLMLVFLIRAVVFIRL